MAKKVEKKRCWDSVSTSGLTLAERTQCLKRNSWRLRYCLVKEMALWSEDLENKRWVRRAMNSSALRLPTVETREDAGERLFEVEEGKQGPGR